MWRSDSGFAISTEWIWTSLINFPLIAVEASGARKPLSRLLKFLLLLNTCPGYFCKGLAQFGITFFPFNDPSISGYHEIIFDNRFLLWHILVGCTIHICITPSSSMSCLKRSSNFWIYTRFSWWLEGMIEVQASFSVVVLRQRILIFVDLRSIPSNIRLL